MKFLFFYFCPFVILYLCVAWYPNSNWYPFGYPVKQGDVWELTWRVQEGTPIERQSTSIVMVDSTFEGYVIKAHLVATNQPYTDGTVMRRFIGQWPHSYPTTAKLIKRK